MKIVKLDNKQVWNKFCYDHAWFWHTTHWLTYLQNSKFGAEYKNHSFFIEQDGKIIGIVPLIQENGELFSPGFDDRKEILQEIKRIATENNIKRIKVNCNIKEYLNISGYTCILDLSNISPTKGHKSAVKRAEKYLTYGMITDIEKFREDYYRIAGKITRPEITFDILAQWINQGFGTLLEAQFDGKTAGYTYILHWKGCAYYFMSCVGPEFREYNISHYLQAKAFDILRQKGVKMYELGEQVYNTLHSQPTEKERNISRFKRGFGGEVVLNPASEYFFDKDYMRQIYADCINNYIRSEYE